MQRAPGQKLLALARRVLSPAEIDRVVEPAMADLQHEWSASADASRFVRVAVRARAYVGALRVIGPRLMAAGARTSVNLPRWSVIRPLMGPPLVIMTAIVLVGSFGPAAARTRDHWLFYVPDRILWCLPMMLATLAGRPGHRALAAGVPRPSAGDLARLSGIVCVCCLAWSGWFAPLFRQQYLLSLNLADFATASVHQWTLPQLIEGAQGASNASAAVAAAELHMRLMPAVLALVCASLGWAGVRASRLWSDGIGTAMSCVGLFALVAFLRIGGFATPRLSSKRILAEWLSLAAILTLTFIAIRIIARIERSRRTRLEGKVVNLLHAITVTRTSRHQSRTHA